MNTKMRALACALAAFLTSVSLADERREAPSGGIWKAAVPATPMKGEFDNNDPLGVAAGSRIKADCSLNWVSPDDGTRYCFASGTSLEYFLDDPNGNIERARTRWREWSH